MNKRLLLYHRIKKREEISNILKCGKRWKCNKFSIFFKKNSMSFDRFAVLVAKREGPAVYRNRIKRIFREIFRKNKRINPPYCDIMIKPYFISTINYHFLEKKYKEWMESLSINVLK